jgi:hypothetical protein
MVGSLISESLNSEQVTAIVIVAMGASCLLIFLITTVVVGTWHKTAALKHETALKRAMIDRGMAADAIVQVLNSHATPVGAANLSCACEAVVQKDGEWQTGLVLQMADDRYYVHFVGSEMNENEWVGEDRIRFRAWSSDPAAIADSRIGRNGAPRKQPMEMEV